MNPKSRKSSALFAFLCFLEHIKLLLPQRLRQFTPAASYLSLLLTTFLPAMVTRRPSWAPLLHAVSVANHGSYIVRTFTRSLILCHSSSATEVSTSTQAIAQIRTRGEPHTAARRCSCLKEPSALAMNS